MSYRLADLARRFGAELQGEGEVEIRGVGTLQDAGPDQIAFLANRKYRRYLPATRAGAVILGAADARLSPVPALVTPNPYALYARVAALFALQTGLEPGRAVGASVARDAVVDPGACIAAGAVIGPGARIAAGVYVGPNCVVEAGARIGEDTRLVANVTICRDVRIGRRVLIHPGAVLGADGFGLAPEDGRWIKVPQLGTVVVGDDVEIGANTTVDRGALGDTVLEEGVKLDNQIQVAHNVVIGAHTAVAGCTAIAGSTTIGRHCMIAGGVGIAGHLTICDGVTVLAMSLVSASIDKPGVYAGSLPIEEAGRWRRNSVRYRQLDELARRLAALEKALKEKDK